MKVKIELSISEYEGFMEKYFPELHAIYIDMVENMLRISEYDELEIKGVLLHEIVPMINKRIEMIDEKGV